MGVALRVRVAACAPFRAVAHLDFFRDGQLVLQIENAVKLCLCALWGVCLQQGGQVGC